MTCVKFKELSLKNSDFALEIYIVSRLSSLVLEAMMKLTGSAVLSSVYCLTVANGGGKYKLYTNKDVNMNVYV